MARLRTILVLGRVSNLPTVWTNVLAGWFLAGGRWSVELLWMEIGVSLLYIAGMTLNDAFDAGWDRQHARERPIPSGAITRSGVWALGFFQMAIGSIFIIGLTDASWPLLASLVGAILLYDWIHKRTVWAAGVMGACRGLVYLLVGSALRESFALNGGFAVPPAVMILYIAGITLSARSERSERGRPRLLLCWIALACAAGGAVIFLYRSVEQVAILLVWTAPIVIWLIYCSEVGKGKGIGPMIGRLIAGITLFDAFFILVFSGAISALGVRSAWLLPALACVVLLPVTLYLQRRIPAT